MGTREEVTAADRQRSGGSRRVTVTLRDVDNHRLVEISESSDLSLNDVIRKALASEAFIQKTLSEGRKILVEDKDGNIREVEFVR